MTGHDGPPRAFISWAHRHRIWSNEQTQQWEATVLAFAHALVENGIDAEIDLWNETTRTDWTRWGQQQVASGGFILVVLNLAWRERWEGSNPPTEGAGVAAEADALKGLFQQNQADFRRRTILIQLPGSGDTQIPVDLHGVTRCVVPSFDAEGLDVLLRLLTRQPRYRRPPLGVTPSLPPRQPPQVPISMSSGGDGDPSSIPDERYNALARASGSGDDIVSLAADHPSANGRWVVRIRGNDQLRHFLIKSGSGGSSLVNTTEQYSGAVLLDAPGTKTVCLEIRASGPWSVEVWEVGRYAAVLDGPRAGTGDEVLVWTDAQGAIRIRGNAQGNHFAVTAHVGSRRRNLVNTTDPYDGRVFLPEGPGVLTIKARGAWSITIDDLSRSGD